MREVTIRPAKRDELAAVAELRWQWGLERAMEHGDSPGTGHEEFVARFLDWAGRHGHSHHCLVAVRDGLVIGMAWLAVLQRVPTPLAVERASGDLQCVYVVPGERDGGLGGLLIQAVLALARELGLERVTVHSSIRAVPAYARHGFAASPCLLQAEPATSSR
ncbi:GNAT family N-acetyltransferase [Amycolatopsis aidingensis]|uniref:GNAT family N-acetyltransferase n=1 Tax=Amycolatopsis aidingensis TaxID=2842453 RepID=UPI001C0BF560|nr:GNAT family N-acetyltransferase [Amycolatopsis aidingensis]